MIRACECKRLTKGPDDRREANARNSACGHHTHTYMKTPRDFLQTSVVDGVHITTITIVRAYFAFFVLSGPIVLVFVFQPTAFSCGLMPSHGLRLLA